MCATTPRPDRPGSAPARPTWKALAARSELLCFPTRAVPRPRCRPVARDALRQRPGSSREHFDGCLFRPIDRHGRVGAPAPATVRQPTHPSRGPLIVKRRRAAAGIDPRLLPPLRSGFATQASANGAAERDVMRHDRWRSVLSPAATSNGAAPLTDNAAGRLGLTDPAIDLDRPAELARGNPVAGFGSGATTELKGA